MTTFPVKAGRTAVHPEILLALARVSGGALALSLDHLAVFSAERMDAARDRVREVQKPKGVAVIPMHGTLMPRASWYGTGMDGLRSAIEGAAADDDVTAIVLSIDSPGGTVAGTVETAATVRAAAERKPVVAHADTLAASAAYWIGSQATRFVVAPSADVGSVGIVAMHADVSRMLSEVGVDITFVHAGEFKVEGNPFQPLGDVARANLQERVDEAHGQFVREVAGGRGTTQTAVRETFGKGRTVGAAKAVEMGMADSVGTLADVLASLGVGSRKAATPARRAALI